MAVAKGIMPNYGIRKILAQETRFCRLAMECDRDSCGRFVAEIRSDYGVEILRRVVGRAAARRWREVFWSGASISFPMPDRSNGELALDCRRGPAPILAISSGENKFLGKPGGKADA